MGSTSLRCMEMGIRSYFMVFCMIMTTQLILFNEALECREGQYEVDGQCCYTCPAGYRVDGTCKTGSATQCVPCEPGTYTTHQQALKECLPCKVCDPELDFITRRECTPTSNTVCRCSPNYVCVKMKDDDCEKCEPHCHPGQYMKSQDPVTNSIICERCQVGTFSPNGSLDQCLPWKNCTAQGLVEKKPGTDTTDAVCLMDRGSQIFYVAVIVLFIILIIAITPEVMKFFKTKKQARDYDVENEAGKIDDSLEVDGSVTNLPVHDTGQKEESVPLTG